MGSKLKIEVTEKERQFRVKNNSDIRGIGQRDLSCCSCGNVLSKSSGRIFSHPIIGIFQCEYCKKTLQKVSFNSKKGDSEKLCYICGRDNKDTYGCKKDDCPYAFCKNCIKRSTPNSLPAAKSGGWECFACNSQPLWKLRGACAIVMSDLSKRTKEKKVESRNVSSDSEDSTSDLRNISYVKRSRLEETKRLGKRLKAVCDDESPVPQDDKLGSANDRQNKRGKSADINVATKRGVKQVSIDKSSRSQRKIEISSEDSDLEEIVISKSKTVVKSQSEREKRNSRKSRNSESLSRKKVITIESSSDEDSDSENTRSFRKSKGKDDSSLDKRKEHRSKRESSANESKSSNSRNKSTHNEKLHSTRQSKSQRKNYQSDTSDDSSSDDSEPKTIKSLKPKEKSSADTKMAKLRKLKESSDDEPKISRIKSKGDVKSSTSRSSNISSVSSKKRLKPPDTIEEEEEEEDVRNRTKKSSVKSPGPKSFKEGKIPRRERSSDEDEDSDRSVRISSKNQEKRRSGISRKDRGAGGFAKSIGRRLSTVDKQKSDSSSGKEFNKSKVLRSSFVVLRPIHDIQEDHTTSPNKDPEIDDTLEVITKDQTFALKNTVNHFYSEMRTAAKKLLDDIERARKSYSMKDSMRVEEANRMVLETKKVAERFRDIVDKGDTQVTEYYDKWCTKTRIKNVLKSSPTTPKPKSTCKPTEESPKKNVSVERTRKKSPEATILNGTNNVVISDCDSEEIFSNEDTRKSIDKSRLSPSIKNANQENDDVSTEPSNREPITLEKSDKDASLSDEEISDNKGNIQSPTMSQFSGLSDVEESTTLQTERVLPSTCEEQIESTGADGTSSRNSENEQVVHEVSSTATRKTRKIQSEPTVLSDRDIEDSAMAVTTPLRSGSEHANSEADALETSADIFDDTDKPEEISDSEEKVRRTETKKKIADVVMKETENSQDSSDKDALNNEMGNLPEISNTNAVNNESEKVPDEDLLAAEKTPNEEPLTVEKTPDEDPLFVENEHTEVASNESCNIHSASTELLGYSSGNLTENSEHDNQSLIIEAKKNMGADDENVENEEEIVRVESPQDAKEDEEEEKEKKDSEQEEKKEKKEKEKNGKKREKGKKENKEKEKTSKEKNKDKVEGKEASDAKQPKTVDSTRNGDSDSSTLDETVLAEEIINNEKAYAGNESSGSTEDLESQNARAKEALLMSSNSDDSSCDERKSTSQSTPNDGNDAPPTPPESDSKIDKSSVDRSLEIESTEKIRKKRSKFRINENRHYIADEKLKRKCVIKLERLKEKTLRQYSRALRKSREYVESKNLQRLVALDKLGKDHKKSSIDCSENEDGSSSKDLNRRTKRQTTKEKEETLLDHLNKVKNGETISELSNESDSESSTKGSKEKDKNKGEDRLLAEANRMAKKRLLESSDSNADEGPVSDAKDDEESKKVKKTTKKEKLDKKSEEDEEKKEESSGKNRWRKNKILTLRISDSDSDEEEKKFNASQEKLKAKNKEGSQSESDEASSKKKKKQTRVRRRVLNSDSDVIISSENSDSDSSVQSVKKKKKKKEESSEDEKDKKKTRKRTRKVRRSSDSSSSLDERPKPTRRKRIKKTGSDSDSDDRDSSQGSPGKSGRKNIRKVLRDKQVAEDTKQAAKEEEERLKRIAERQKLYNEMYEVRLAGEEKVDKLVLDFDEETKEPLVSVDENLVKRLKPHQAQGIKFMWDACFESLERIKSTKGSGCILAHCMGLGKSFQVVTLAHTLLSHEETGVKTVLVVCPLSTVLNWANEFKIWLADIENADDIEVYEMTKMKKNFERKFQLTRWQETGGVMIIGYEMFRNLTQQTGKKVRKNIQESFLKCLVDPGPDLIVCDEGHLLKNEDTALSKAMRRVKTLRRVVLTGTPLQNNLIEYHCMVQFVKPNLLGTKKEFMNRFENPITNGQFDDSTEYDVKLMKKRAHILHKLLEGSVQRFDYSVLTPFLPPKQEYVIFVKLTKIQLDMYQHYLDNYARRHRGVGGSLFADFQALQRIWTHPMVMQMNAEKVEKANEKKRLDATDSEGSLRDFIDDGSDTPCTSNSSDDASDDDKKTKTKRSTRANPVAEEPVEEVDLTAASEEAAATTDESQWWTQYVKEDDYEDIRCSSKLLILFRIIKESEQIGDKILVFSQSLYSLTLIERFLELIDEETQKGNEPEKLDGLSGSWALGLDYFRLDGQTSADNRRRWCDIFNRPTNTRARLFLISTRAGGLGINLTAANRVVIFDASWNPSHDVQSIFRIYRFGQKKPCYVYRLLAAGTMEEKIYNRQVTKLSLSCRVVDEQQIERHYSNNALAELYKLELPSETETTLALPKDRLLAEIFLKYKSSVENYHEHDSLLENQAGEELDEEERQQAWLEYEEEKKGKRVMVPQPFMNYQDAYLMQQMNAMNMAVQQNTLNNPAMLSDYQSLQRLMEKDYPGIPEAQQKIMASQAVYEMYNYVEKQAMANHRGAVGGGMQLPNLGGLQGVYNNQAQPVNARQTYMDILRMQQQQQQLLAQQQHNGQMKFANTQQQLRADILRQQQQQQLQFAQQAQRMGQSSTAPSITIDDDDIMEVSSAPEKTPVPSAQASEANPKNKEE